MTARKKKRRKRKMRTSKKVLWCAILGVSVIFPAEFVLLYTGATGFPYFFVIGWLSFWGYELFILAGLKKDERRNPYIDIKDTKTGGSTNAIG